MRTVASLVVLGLITGCAAKSSVSETTAQGQLALSTFPEHASAVIARSASGMETVSTPSATGAFALSLAKGESYSIRVVMESRSVVVGMPRTSGAIDRSFKVSSAGVRIDLGVVRYHAAGATDPVVPGAEAASCEDGSNDGEEGTQGAEGECVKGIDSTTKAPCSDVPEAADPADTVDANAEMAVPEHDAPADASGCEQGGEKAGE
jgi:hypothetical protein